MRRRRIILILKGHQHKLARAIAGQIQLREGGGGREDVGLDDKETNAAGVRGGRLDFNLF